MTQIYLIRHTQAEGNRYRMMQGHWDGDVTPLGVKEIEALSVRFRDIPVDAVYSSDLTRAVLTAEGVARSKGLPVHQDVRLREWAEQLEAQQASGLTVPQWCAENGIKTKSFYYRLRRVREQYIQSAHAVVPLTVPQQQSADIRIEKNGLHISLPTSITKDTLLALVNALC